MPAGTYLLDWSVELGATLVSVIGQVRVQLDAVTQNETAEQLIGEFAAHAGIRVVALSAAAHTVTIDFRDTTPAIGAAQIRRARVLLYRIGP